MSSDLTCVYFSLCGSGLSLPAIGLILPVPFLSLPSAGLTLPVSILSLPAAGLSVPVSGLS